MAKIINLRLRSKQKQREERAAMAAENAVKHGRTKAQKQAERAAADASARQLDAHKRADP